MGVSIWSRARAAWRVIRSQDASLNSFLTGDDSWGSPSATGIKISQQTAMQATAVMACVSILTEDVSKMTPQIFRRVTMGQHQLGGRVIAKDHFLYPLLRKPNTWQTWPEFCRMMVAAFLMRGNAYAVILRNGRGTPVMFVPINPDRVSLWESPGGSLFFMVTRSGLHELALLREQPFLIPYEDVFHLKDLSANGLVGLSRIALAREAIALSLGQEQQYARMMGNGARPSGFLSTDKPLSAEVAKRLKDNWNDLHTGLLNSGRTAVLEAGVKWNALSLSMVDLQFLAARQFQVIEIARIFRVPPHMIGDLTRGVPFNAQDYRNGTLTSHSDIWEKRLDFTFDLEGSDLLVDFDESALLKADLTARSTANRVGRFGGWLTVNEIRMSEGLNPVDGGDVLWMPTNMQPVGDEGLGSNITGGGAEGAGKPAADTGQDPDATDQGAPSV